MLKTFFAMAPSSLGRDHDRHVGVVDPVGEVLGPAAPRPFDPVARAALVDAQAAVHPVDLARVFLEQAGGPVLRGRVLLLLGRRPLHRVGMGRLLGHRQVHRALVGEDVDLVALAEGGVDDAERRGRRLLLVRRIHEGDRHCLGHVRPPQCQMTLRPSSATRSTRSSMLAVFTPLTSSPFWMPRSRREKPSASTVVLAESSATSSAAADAFLVGSTPFCTRKTVTSWDSSASPRARSYVLRTSPESK